MLSEQGQALLLRRSYKYDFQEELVTRPRLCSDDLRLFFRSMAISQSENTSEGDTQQRNEDDDRDLLDVMISIMARKMIETQSKWGYTREELLAIAHTLPSSFSQATDGYIRHEEICALLNLLVVLKPTKASAGTNRNPDSIPTWRYICECVDGEWGSWIVDRGSNDASHRSLEDLVHTLQHPEMQSKPVHWESFCYLLQGTYVSFSHIVPPCDKILTLCPSFLSWKSYVILLNVHSINPKPRPSSRRSCDYIRIAGARGPRTDQQTPETTR
jgi:hypothetical protein